MNSIVCKVCFKEKLSKDEIGINKKLLNPDAKDFYCIECLAQCLDVSIQDILDKIEEFKDEGCTLFN